MKDKAHASRRQHYPLPVFGVIMLLLLISIPAAALAQETPDEQPRIQVLTGRIFADELLQYRLPALREGDTLYVEMSNISGNLDPLLLLTTPEDFSEELLVEMRAELASRTAAGVDPVLAAVEIVRANVLAGNDNYDRTSTAAFAFDIPQDGDYLLLARSTLTNDTFGDYKLVIGLNAPDVLDGRAAATGDEIAFLDREASGIASAVQAIEGELNAEQHQWFYTVPTVDAQDTLYARVETLSGDLVPVLELSDYSGRLLRQANATGQAPTAAFEFSAGAATDNLRITVRAWADGETATAGEYRLLVGLNEPAVLQGTAEPEGRPPISGAIPVTVSVILQQITGVDQKSENYGGVYYLQLDWQDPSQAFNPDDCQCNIKSYTGPGFNKLVSDEAFVWPAFTIFNQQNNRWIQNQGLIIAADGRMRYFERFTTTLQAPDFNFRAFPFDQQQFFLRVDALYPQTYYQFLGPPELSTLGDQLGEEEWVITEYGTSTGEVGGVGDLPSSRFSFGFQARRHLNFYIMRIFLPTLLIIIVSYFTFFLQNYSKRIDVTSANLLVFVAFNFTISDDLPRLGYLTFMDAILAGVFVITALSLAFNVYLRRLEIKGKEERARKIDSYTLWLYPTLYIVGGIILTIYFLLPDYWEGIATWFSQTFAFA
jgi:hypothetical protein